MILPGFSPGISSSIFPGFRQGFLLRFFHWLPPGYLWGFPPGIFARSFTYYSIRDTSRILPRFYRRISSLIPFGISLFIFTGFSFGDFSLIPSIISDLMPFWISLGISLINFYRISVDFPSLISPEILLRIYFGIFSCDSFSDFPRDICQDSFIDFS